ncbi:hypothetical protein K435DRAFT_806898 [Dendrothele bispora CBS 962.96]|uniref:Uncharacterized protein n=1 Tax=Dendrothele bispora (strain CBS 962.96) TaxID=1314807 RepID=A0A4S8L7Q2_DENBC|nr:hypothetical protein K435DRAFT_806898 [Dendrothele bispora CBS 962.96]
MTHPNSHSREVQETWDNVVCGRIKQEGFERETLSHVKTLEMELEEEEEEVVSGSRSDKLTGGSNYSARKIIVPSELVVRLKASVLFTFLDRDEYHLDTIKNPFSSMMPAENYNGYHNESHEFWSSMQFDLVAESRHAQLASISGISLLDGMIFGIKEPFSSCTLKSCGNFTKPSSSLRETSKLTWHNIYFCPKNGAIYAAGSSTYQWEGCGQVFWWRNGVLRMIISLDGLGGFTFMIKIIQIAVTVPNYLTRFTDL